MTTINYRAELAEMFNRCYQFAKGAAKDFANWGNLQEAQRMILIEQNRAYGAVEILTQIADNNGYREIAKECMDFWNDEWRYNFDALYKEYAD